MKPIRNSILVFNYMGIDSDQAKRLLIENDSEGDSP